MATRGARALAGVEEPTELAIMSPAPGEIRRGASALAAHYREGARKRQSSQLGDTPPSPGAAYDSAPWRIA